MNLYGIIMLTAGVVLMYSAVQNADPRDVVKNALQGKPTPKHGVTTNPDTGRRSGGGTFGSALPTTPNDGTQVVSV